MGSSSLTKKKNLCREKKKKEAQPHCALGMNLNKRKKEAKAGGEGRLCKGVGSREMCDFLAFIGISLLTERDGRKRGRRERKGGIQK